MDSWSNKKTTSRGRWGSRYIWAFDGLFCVVGVPDFCAVASLTASARQTDVLFLMYLRIFTASELPLVSSNSNFDQARLRTTASGTFFSGSVNRNGMSSIGICNTPLPK